MSDSIPVNLSGIQQKAGLAEAKKMLARQVLSQARLKEDLSEEFNPAAAERQLSRVNRFRPLETRRKTPDEAKKIAEIKARSEEDLAQDFFRRNPELPADRLLRLRQSLRRGSSPQEVLDEVNTAFEDPTLADEVLDYLEQATEGDLQNSVRSARRLLNETKGREIIAGRNIDEVAKAFHKKGLAESPTALRDLYREITGEPKDHNALFSELSAKYPFEELQQVVAFLLKGLGYDLKSKGPSIQVAELIRLMTETRNLQSILWVYLYFKSRMRLVRSLYKKYGKADKKSLTFEKLAKTFIKLVEERYPSVVKLLKMGDGLGFDDEEKVIIFIQFRDAIRSLSPRLYRSVKHRQDLLLVILEALEELETDEDEETQ